MSVTKLVYDGMKFLVAGVIFASVVGASIGAGVRVYYLITSEGTTNERNCK